MSVTIERRGANILFGAAVYGSFLVASVVVASRRDGNHGPLEARSFGVSPGIVRG